MGDSAHQPPCSPLAVLTQRVTDHVGGYETYRDKQNSDLQYVRQRVDELNGRMWVLASGVGLTLLGTVINLLSR
jgi:hypothetical protein